MGHIKQHIVFFLLIFCSVIARGQTYPVQAFVQVSPPYNSYLPDYADPFTNQMRVLLTLTDFAIPSTQVKLRFSIEGSGYSMVSTDLIAFPTITLTPGIPVEISGSDLAPYLMTENLIFSGLSPGAYELSKVLPEGPATICVEVVNVSSPNQPVIGNPACAQTWFSLYDPPLINLPFCGSDITPADPQAVLFNWTPLHMASPLAGMTEYIFELYEMRPDESDPNVVVTTTLPIYIEMTSNTMVNYGIIQAPLQVGMTYVWRVQAKDPTGRDLYRNNGYSEVCTFTYGSIAGSLIDGVTLELNANGTGVRQGLAWWNASDLFESYELELRKTGDDAYEWFPYSTDQGSLKVNNLEPETEYECRVKGVVGGAESDWSNIADFTTQAQNDYACGSTVLPAVSPVNIPLNNLIPSDIVAVGQFEMMVTSAEPTYAPGRFTGRGKIQIPFMLMNVNVEFYDIYIDEDLVMREGRVEAMTEGIDEWADGFGNIFIPGIINSPGGFEFNEDSTLTVRFGDEELTFEFPANGGPLVFEDESGLIYTVYPDGRIEIGGDITYDDDVLAASANHQITFHKDVDQTYGFDEKRYLQWTKYYPCIKLNDGTLYFTAYKSVASNESDHVIAKIHSIEGVSSPSFAYADGTPLSAYSINDSTYKVQVGNTLTSKYIYAYDDAGAKIGKLNLSVYAPKTHDLVIVPVNEATFPADLEAKINSTFIQANVQFNITIASPYSNESFDLDENGLESPNTSLMDKYSEEMRLLRDAYFAEREEENNTYYIFVVPEFDGDLDGYMVRGKSLGFVKSNESAHTYSHELGHGAFGLKHTFPIIPTGTTNNLLDYTADSTHLTHDQWYEMQHFTPVFSILDNEEDGSIVQLPLEVILDFYYTENTFFDVDDKFAFPLLDGTFLKIEGVDQIVFNKFGKVYKFKIEDEIFQPRFVIDQSNNSIYYSGYFDERSMHKLDSLRDLEGVTPSIVKESRFNGFISAEPSDSVYTMSLDQYNGNFVDCYCELVWQNNIRSSASNYSIDGWYYSRNVNIAFEFPEHYNKGNCEGTCIDYEDYEISGPAEYVFIDLASSVDPEKLLELEVLTIYLNREMEGSSFRFFSDYQQPNIDEAYISFSADVVEHNNSFIKFLLEQEIFSLSKFKQYFGDSPIMGGRYSDVLFSNRDFWDGIPEDYNSNTIDYVLESEGVSSLYIYTLEDLMKREQFENLPGPIIDGIIYLERDGEAKPIAINEGYDQYVAKYGTNSAAFALLESFTATMGPVFIAFGGYQIVGMFASVSFSATFGRISTFTKDLAPYLQSFVTKYIQVRTRQAIMAGVKSYLAYLMIDATLRVCLDLSPDFITALGEVDQGAAALQGTVDGLSAFIDMPDIDLSIFNAIGTCAVGVLEADGPGESAINACLFNGLVSIITSSSGNIIKILVNRIKALGARSTKFLTFLKEHLTPADHPFYDNFDFPAIYADIINGLKSKFKYNDEIVIWLDEIIENPALSDEGISDLFSKLDDLPSDKVDDFIGDFNDELKDLFSESPGTVEAWEIISTGSQSLRINTINLLKIDDFISSTGMEKPKLINSFGNSKNPQKWIDMKVSEIELEIIYDGFKNAPPVRFEAWTLEHKAQRWNNHKIGNPQVDYKTWSNRYDGNIDKAVSANLGVDDYFSTLSGNVVREKSFSNIIINTPDGIQSFTRRLDIVDEDLFKGIEFKEYSSGKVYRSVDIKREYTLDGKLLQDDLLDEIEWIFKGCKPSGPLRTDLESLGIKITLLP